MGMVEYSLELKSYKVFSRWGNFMVRDRWRSNMIKMFIATEVNLLRDRSTVKEYRNLKGLRMMVSLTKI